MSLINDIHYNLNIIKNQAQGILKKHPQYNLKLHRVLGFGPSPGSWHGYLLRTLILNDENMLRHTDPNEDLTTKNMILQEDTFDQTDDLHFNRAYSQAQNSMAQIINIYKDFIHQAPDKAYNAGIANALNLKFGHGDNDHLADYILKTMANQGIVTKYKKDGSKQLYRVVREDLDYQFQPQEPLYDINKAKTQSLGEAYLSELIISGKIILEHQKTFPGCKYKKLLRYDLFLPEYDLLIEFNGRQHYEFIPFFHKIEENFKLEKKRFKIKENFAQENDLAFVCISYAEKNIKEALIREVYQTTGFDFSHLI
jgi:hypothetical protein